ncbi:MAG: 4Fe-4S binding protein [Polaromonas sp.]|nr:4Fe-4S binding protein [Polaromonas sp.]
MPTLICDCNQTMPLQPQTLGAALNETLTLHSALCRREAGAFQKAIQSGDDVVVACTQEKRLFAEVAQQTQGASSPIRFVNIRETGGWSKDASQAMPKIAALLAAAHLPEPEPVSTVTYTSAGRLLIIGELDAAERAADLLGDALDVTLFTQGAGNAGGDQERRYPVLAGKIQGLTGWLGAFELKWLRNNPIDLDLCTRCNACVAACPEGAIGLDYQIDSALCQSHRACVKVYAVAGAIDFSREPEKLSEKFDLVLDLRPTAAFTQQALPQGYFRWDGRDIKTITQVRSLVGEFEKPKFFLYKQKLCAHSRNDKTGCSACIDVCSASAISSERDRQQIKVNPNLCIGCGACTTVCPSGALSYAYPRASEQGVKIKTLLTTYSRAGGKNAALLLHSQEAGARLLGDLGRAARLDPATQGVPARVLPVALWHTSSIGLELWLSAVAYGASQVWVLMTGEEAPQYREAVRTQMDVAQAILKGLGYQGEHFRILQARDARDLASLDADLQCAPAQCVGKSAGFAVQADKRATLELVLDHLVAQAPARPEVIALPAAGSPFGSLAINKETCTLCLSCVSACPASALQDNPQLPQLKFIEKNCVQCGLCVKTCPEKSLTLVPQLLLTAQRKEPVVINEMKPYACVRCSKPFGTLKAIESMLGKLAGHAMFQGAAAERLKMCSDCRVIDLYSADNEIKITDIR